MEKNVIETSQFISYCKWAHSYISVIEIPMNGDNSLHSSIYISLNLELRKFLTILLQGNIIIQYIINLRKLNFLHSEILCILACLEQGKCIFSKHF